MLRDRTVVVTRAADQAGALIQRLQALGAEVLAVPAIVTLAVDGADAAYLAAAAAGLDRYDWVVWTSVNGVDATLAARSPGAPSPRRVAVVGRATAARVRTAGLPVDLVPDRHTGAALAAAFPPAPPAGTRRVLVAQGDRAAATVADGLRAKGWDLEVVTAYRTCSADVAPDVAARTSTADAITFTSGSTVTGYLATGAAVPPVVVTLGPVTTRDATAAGLTVAAEAREATVDGLVAAVVEALAAG